MPVERKKIVKSYLLLCEGRDAEGFMINYLESKALAYEQRFSNDIQVLDFGGNEDLDSFLLSLKNMDRFSRVTNLAVVRDAETNYEKACQSVAGSLKRCGFASPGNEGMWVCNDAGLNTGYLLFPLNHKAGTLEDLCLQILSESNNKDILSSVDTFLETMENSYGRIFHRKHKNKLHTYLSTNDKYVTMPLGLASKAGAFNWDSVCLDPLKCFLEDGFNL